MIEKINNAHHQQLRYRILDLGRTGLRGTLWKTQYRIIMSVWRWHWKELVLLPLAGYFSMIAFAAAVGIIYITLPAEASLYFLLSRINGDSGPA